MESWGEIWRKEGFGVHKEWVQGHTRQVSCLLLTSDEKWVVSGSYDKKLSLWNFTTKSKFKDLAEFDDSITALHFFNNPKVNFLIVGLKSGNIILNESEPSSFPFSLGPSFELKSHSLNITSIDTLSPSQIASSSWDSKICIWDLDQRVLQKVIKSHKSWVNSLIVLNSTLISCSNDQTIQFHQLNKENPQILQLNDKVTSIRISKKLQNLVSGNSYGDIEIWDLKDLGKVFEVRPSEASVGCIQVNWDQVSCWAGYLDGIIVQVDIVYQVVSKKLEFSAGINFILLSKYSNFLVLAGKNGSIGYADCGIEDLQVRSFHGHEALVHRAMWVEEGKIMLTADCLGNVSLWDLEERRLIVKIDEISEYVMDLAFDPETFIIAYSSPSKKIFFYDLVKLSKMPDLTSPSVASKFLYFSNYNLLYQTSDSQVSCLDIKCTNFISLFSTNHSISSFSIRSKYIVLAVNTKSFTELHVLKFTSYP